MLASWVVRWFGLGVQRKRVPEFEFELDIFAVLGWCWELVLENLGGDDGVEVGRWEKERADREGGFILGVWTGERWIWVCESEVRS